MAAKKPKSISLKSIEKQYKNINKYSTHPLKCKAGESIRYYEKFSDKKIQELLAEANKDLVYDAENELYLISDDDTKFIKYVYFLTIKHMTELKNEIPDSFEEKISIFNQIEEIGLFREMMEDVFDPAEVSKVIDYMANFALMAQRVKEIEDEAREKAINSVKNPVIKKKLEEGKLNNA